MKYIITFSIALALSINAIAQTGLVFNQCLTFSGDGPWTSPTVNSSVSPQFIVPEGKIWKLEYAYAQVGGGFLRVNGYTASNLSSSSFPIWLKSGDTVDFIAGTFPPVSIAGFFLSILEFNSN